MKSNKLFQVLFILTALLSMYSCSSDDEITGDGTKRLAQIVVKEHEKKFGEFTPYGELYEEYNYNDKNQLYHKKTNYFVRNDIGRILEEYHYMYDEKGRLISKREDSLWGRVYKYTYNNIDSIATMVVYDEDGDLSESWAYTYDDNRKLIEARQTGGRLTKYVITYSYNGRITTEVRRIIDTNELFGTTHYEYDEYNNLVKETWINGETGKKSISEWNYTYNSNGQMTRKISHDNIIKDALTIYDYTYNPDGTNNTTRISYSYKDKESELRYEYIYK